MGMTIAQQKMVDTTLEKVVDALQLQLEVGGTIEIYKYGGADQSTGVLLRASNEVYNF